MMQRAPLVVYSHLRWDDALKRPHHVMSRIAASRPVLFVEEPVTTDGDPALDIVPLSRSLHIARPKLPHVEAGAGFSVATQELLAGMLRRELAGNKWDDHAAWLYTPMAVSVAKRLRPQAIVYECITSPTALYGAPEDVLDRERELLLAADAVMTAGPSLQRALNAKHSFVRCFPHSVDAAHFERRAWVDDVCDQEDVPHPRLGYYGTIDERVDLALIDALAAAHPEWQIVLIGPCKLDRSALPSRPNVHVLNERGYAELPAYSGHWDLGLLPFAINEATVGFNPCQTLEYVAADLPVVGTPLEDVLELHGDLVQTARSAMEFVEECEKALAPSAAQRSKRRNLAKAALKKTSWDETVHHMDDILRYIADTQRVREVPGWIPVYQGVRL